MSTWDQIQTYCKSLAHRDAVLPCQSSWTSLHSIEMHTAGEPLRVILQGFPALRGRDILEKRRDARQRCDFFRKALIWEPRGHADMYGCLLVEANDHQADFGILFLHNEGYSTMCGHAIIAISKLVFLMGWKKLQPGENLLRIDTPCGRICSLTEFDQGQPGQVSFDCVPSFVAGLDRKVQLPDLGTITYDLAYGGAFYAYVDLRRHNLGLRLVAEDYRQIVDLGKRIKQAVQRQDRSIRHPLNPEMEFLYGTLFIDDAREPGGHSRHVCVFADGEVDRSPTGSGVSGRLAILFAREQIRLGEEIAIESILGTRFSGSVIESVNVGSLPAVIPRVSGNAYVVGRSQFWIDPGDPLQPGFLLH